MFHHFWLQSTQTRVRKSNPQTCPLLTYTYYTHIQTTAYIKRNAYAAKENESMQTISMCKTSTGRPERIFPSEQRKSGGRKQSKSQSLTLLCMQFILHHPKSSPMVLCSVFRYGDLSFGHFRWNKFRFKLKTWIQYKYQMNVSIVHSKFVEHHRTRYLKISFNSENSTFRSKWLNVEYGLQIKCITRPLPHQKAISIKLNCRFSIIHVTQ